MRLNKKVTTQEGFCKKGFMMASLLCGGVLLSNKCSTSCYLKDVHINKGIAKGSNRVVKAIDKDIKETRPLFASGCSKVKFKAEGRREKPDEDTKNGLKVRKKVTFGGVDVLNITSFDDRIQQPISSFETLNMAFKSLIKTYCKINGLLDGNQVQDVCKQSLGDVYKLLTNVCTKLFEIYDAAKADYMAVEAAKLADAKVLYAPRAAKFVVTKAVVVNSYVKYFKYLSAYANLFAATSAICAAEAAEAAIEVSKKLALQNANKYANLAKVVADLANQAYGKFVKYATLPAIKSNVYKDVKDTQQFADMAKQFADMAKQFARNVPK